ncbi:MAG: hypothetical protein HY678_07990 [Chloroflexi bacterium]|nr:hypothetical protein [Chloroflexota bacterium]
MPETQTPASAPAAPPAEAGATPGAADAGHAPAGAAATPTAENDPRTLQLMQIFTEEAEGANLNANVYEPFLAPLTMEEVARNARALLDELKALRYG